MEKTIVARWQDWEGTGIQHLVLRRSPQRIVAEAVVVGREEGTEFGAHFRIECDGEWRARRVTAGLVGGEGIVELASDGAGHWRDGGGATLPDLDGAIDVDLPVTPFTNTLPIRRLGLGAGQSADLKVAYVMLLPEPRVVPDPQRYVCLEPGRRYRYDSLDSDFVREIEVDEDGLVTLYPGLFRRI